MISGRTRLINAARELLQAQPRREPSTRELYDAAGVAAPTLYHHFGTKEGLLDEIVEQAFAEYLERKQDMLRTGDLVANFGAGWDLHVEFGVANPVLYSLMYSPGRSSTAAATADEHLRSALKRMGDAGLLHVEVDTAASMTTGMAVGCVMQLNRLQRPVTDPAAVATRAALIAAITEGGSVPSTTTPEQAARLLLSELSVLDRQFTSAEAALFTQWLRHIAVPDATRKQETHQP